MNSGKTEREAAHRRATAEAACWPCLACGRPAPSLPAHYPKHRGMGGGGAGWGPDEWVPLCYLCHEALDARNGVSPVHRQRTEEVRAKVAEGAPFFCRRIPDDPPIARVIHRAELFRREKGLYGSGEAPSWVTPTPPPQDFDEVGG